MAPPPARRRRWRGPLLLCLILVGSLAVGTLVWLQGHVGSVLVREVCTAEVGEATTRLDPDQAGHAATIAGIAVRRGLPARAASIGIAVAMQESKLRNLTYGDRDSLGLFQQRPSQGWGTVEEVSDPVYATNAFYDVLVKVEGFQNLEITKAAQKVQRSAFPSAYAQHESQARALASSLTGYSEAAFSCVMQPASATLPGEDPGPDGLTTRSRAVATAAGEEIGGHLAGPLNPEGTAVRFTTEGNTRLAWGLAQWAVARSDGLNIVSVETDGRRWSRADSTAGWVKVKNSTLETGSVGIEVATGE